MLDKAMASHSSTLAWKIPWTEEPGKLQSMGSLRVDMTSLSLSCIGEGNGNPLQCSCLENPRDGGAWWVAVYGVGHDWSDLAAACLPGTPSSWLVFCCCLVSPQWYTHWFVIFTCCIFNSRKIINPRINILVSTLVTWGKSCICRHQS